MDGDIFDLYFNYVEKSSEAPFQFHRWALITGVGALLGRQAWLPFGFDVIYANTFVVLLGPSASRKSSAIKIMRGLLESTGYNTFARDKSSKEMFLSDLAKGFGPSKPSDEDVEEILDEDFDDPNPKEVLITAGELEDFMGAKDSGLISLLTNLYDCLPKYEQPKLTGKHVAVHKPTVSMIGGATETTFATTFPPEVIGQGFMSRTPLIYADGPRCKITCPPLPNPEIGAFLVDRLSAVREHIKGAMTVHPETFKIWDEVYQLPFPIKDLRLVSYAGRRHIHFYKLCMIVAALDLSMEILPEHAVKANSILHYTESLMPRALGEFGKSLNSAQTHGILKAIESAGPVGLDLAGLMKIVASDVKDIQECLNLVRKLKDAGKVEVNPRTAKFTAVTSKVKKQYPHTDFTNLREYNPNHLKDEELDYGT